MVLVILHTEPTVTDRCTTVTIVICRRRNRVFFKRHHSDDPTTTTTAAAAIIILFVVVEHSQHKPHSNFPLLTVVMHDPVGNH